MKPNRVIPFFVFSFFILSCSNTETGSSSDKNSEVNASPNNQVSIHLSADELAQTNIETDRLREQPISAAVACFGTLEALPDQLVSITTPMGGRITNLNYVPGDFVKQGAVLATLEDLEIIKLQEAFLEAKALLKYAEQDYKRQGQLTVENAASIKRMQDAEAAYWSEKARYESLKKQLQMLNLDVATIAKGDLQSHMVLRSPISGFVTTLNGNLGKFVEARSAVYQVVDISQLHAHLQVYQRSITQLQPGMKMQFEVVGVPDTKRVTTLQNVGQMLKSGEQSFSVYASIENEDALLKPGMKIQGEIFLQEKTYYTIPSEGIVTYNDESVVFIYRDEQYRPVPVTKGPEYGDWVGLIDPDEQLKTGEVVVKGAYYLVGQLWNQTE
ncbi:MAG: efflux RND transporter periplasmic adaptor subunit [Bacteroidales bacterium]